MAYAVATFLATSRQHSGHVHGIRTVIVDPVADAGRFSCHCGAISTRAPASSTMAVGAVDPATTVKPSFLRSDCAGYAPSMALATGGLMPSILAFAPSSAPVCMLPDPTVMANTPSGLAPTSSADIIL